MIDTERAAKFIYAALTGNSALNTAVSGRIYRDLAPQRETVGPDAFVPCVVFSSQSAVDINANGGHHVADEELWLVKAIDKGESYGALKAIGDAIYTALHGVKGTVDDAYVGAMVRESSPPQPAEVDHGVRYCFLNQIFRLWIYPT